MKTTLKIKSDLIDLTENILRIFPSANNFGLSSAIVFMGELRTVSNYELPSKLLSEMECYVATINTNKSTLTVA